MKVKGKERRRRRRRRIGVLIPIDRYIYNINIKK